MSEDIGVDPMEGYDRAADTMRQTCKMCGCKQYFEFRVPDDLWDEVVPERYRKTALCLACFDACAFEAMRQDWPTEVLWITFVGRWTVFNVTVDFESCPPQGIRFGGLTAEDVARIERHHRETE